MAALSIEVITKAADEHALAVFGTHHDDGKTVVLLGPREPGFWSTFTASPEYRDGAPDPLDRWSRQVIDALATKFDARAVFPSDGPPYPPFIAWAKASARCWESPVSILIHDRAGLMVSYRGALILPAVLGLPKPPIKPCTACTKPCLTACPVNALTADGYDVATCKAHVRSDAGRPCRETGCLVRQACPVSVSYGRLAEQSAFHMKAFLGP